MNPLNPLTQQPLTDGELTELKDLVEKLLGAESDIASMEEQLKLRKQDLLELSTVKIPEKMQLLGMRSYVLLNGETVILKPLYQCYLSDSEPELKARGLAWLRANKLDAIIKSEAKVQIPKESDKFLRELRKFLDKRGIAYGVAETVHNATLKSLMRERIEGGKEFPMDIFRGFNGKIAKVDRPD